MGMSKLIKVQATDVDWCINSNSVVCLLRKSTGQVDFFNAIIIYFLIYRCYNLNMSNKKDNKTKKILSWIAVIVWMGVIFCFSSMNSDNSSNVSEGLIADVVTTVTTTGNKIGLIKTMPSESEMNLILETAHVPVRKVAHFTEYLILAILVSNALVNSNVTERRKLIYYTLLICLLYSISDEIHQLFISGRAGKVIDVLIDTLGSMMGIIISNIILNKRKVLK
jgi:VanZ family protein